jgi:hypothetical protein
MQDVFDHLLERSYVGSFFGPEGVLPLDRFVPDVHQKRDGGRFWDAPNYCNNFLFVPNHSSRRTP